MGMAAGRTTGRAADRVGEKVFLCGLLVAEGTHEVSGERGRCSCKEVERRAGNSSSIHVHDEHVPRNLDYGVVAGWSRTRSHPPATWHGIAKFRTYLSLMLLLLARLLAYPRERELFTIDTVPLTLRSDDHPLVVRKSRRCS